jgi:hypothetical protein
MKASQTEIRDADAALRVAGEQIDRGSTSIPARIDSMEDADGLRLVPTS